MSSEMGCMVTNAYLSIKNPKKIPGPLSGPWTPLQMACFARGILLEYVGNFRPQKLWSPW